jgi:hypothetical protein
MFDPANDLAWTGGITSSHPDRPGPLTVGCTVVRTARFLRRTFTYGYTVTAAEPDQIVQMHVEKPFPMVIRYTLTDAGTDATTVEIHAVGSPGRFFGLFSPMMASQVRRSIQADLERLRMRLEGEAIND